ncbi:MAG TPA: hypothetical protein VK919_14830 [Solirubrobacterales bacterium]|nr:hypothetical protein [Solirubrobacterales bacterium]
MLGLVALLLAFGLSLALSRYEDRRASIVAEANAIGTTWLRAQTLPEPIRGRSLGLLVRYTESAIDVADYRPGSEAELTAATGEEELQRQLWALAGRALAAEPEASAPRLYVETLNEMIDMQTVRVAILNNRVPSAVLLLEIFGAALAVGLLTAYLVLSGRGLITVSFASILVVLVLFVIADLDRPTRGEIQVPDQVLVDQLESMRKPPAAAAPASAGAAPGRS